MKNANTNVSYTCAKVAASPNNSVKFQQYIFNIYIRNNIAHKTTTVNNKQF